MATEPAGSITIGELTGATGVPPATLRSWEARYGFPRPQRAAAGHRRYHQGDIALVEEVLRRRAAGLSLPAAIAQATGALPPGDQSVFAVLRRRHPGLQPRVLRKTALLALTRAIEDEYCARAERAFLFASFQRERHYRRSEVRWNELARTAESVVVFSDFAAAASGAGTGAASGAGAGAASGAGANGADTAGTAGTPWQVAVPAGSPLRREWALVCEARDYPVCLAGWELPGQHSSGEGGRRFEVLWTLEPRPVRDAAVTCARLAESFRPGLRLLDRLPAEPAPPACAELRHAAGLLTRMAAYLGGLPA